MNAKELVREYIEKVWNQGDLRALLLRKPSPTGE